MFNLGKSAVAPVARVELFGAVFGQINRKCLTFGLRQVEARRVTCGQQARAE